MKLASLFTGYGGLDRAVEQHFGAETVWCSDIDPGACRIIEHRYPGIPNLGDITRIDWSQVEPVDVLTGGFPCQDLSHAGKRAGMHDGTRSGLWSHMAAAIEQLRPRYVVAENVRGLLSASAASDLEPCPWCLGGAADGEPALRALGCVLGDLAELGYDARWCGLRAADVGAPHGRFRVFIFATDTARHAGLRSVARSDQRDVPFRDGPGARSTADTQRGGRDGRTGQLGPRRWAEPEDGGHTPADTTGNGRHQGRPEPARLVGGSDAAERGDAPANTASHSGRVGYGECLPAGQWGPYAPAINRWATTLGRVAPAPTETSARGSQRLSPSFVEWMMGLPAGWVTDVPGLTRNAQLKALGNGVVPQQALAALRLMDQIEAAA